MSFSPSSLCAVAATGQTTSQGAFSQCMQGTGWLWMRGSSMSTAQHLLLAHHGDVVLRLAGDDAGAAAGADVEVDRHSPRVALVLPARVEGLVGLRLLAHFLDDLRISPSGPIPLCLLP